MNRLVRLILPFLVILLLVSQCKDPYQFKTNSREGLLVIDGGISDRPGPYYLKLGLTTNAHLKPSPVGNAIVYVTDESGQSEYYDEMGNGDYRLNGNTIQGKQGSTYILHITLQDGRTYESSQETMPSDLKPIDSTFFKVDNENLISSEGVDITNWKINIYLNTKFQAKSGHYRWSVDEVYSLFPTCPPGAISCPKICYVYVPLTYYNLFVIDRSEYSENSIYNIHLQSAGVDFTFATRHYFNVNQHAMNTNAYNYWKKVQQLISKRGSIFDAPPYTITGNMRNTSDPEEMVFGYFEATAMKTTRLFIDRGNIPTYVATCFLSLPDYSNEKYCNNCEYLPGSTHDEPDWFW